MRRRQPGQPIRILVVEDSRTQLELLVRVLEKSGPFEIAGTASSGPAAVDATLRLLPDVIALDINLPGFDGYEVTRQVMQRCPTPIVMISSTSTNMQRRSVDALAAGALAVVLKPASLSHKDHEADRRTLVTTLRLMADVPVVTRFPARTPPGAPGLSGPLPPLPSPSQRQVLAIAASTGGPGAIQTILSGLGPEFPLPIMLVQHISRGFTATLAEWLSSATRLPAHVLAAEERAQPGHLYLAPEDQHLVALRPGIVGIRQGGGVDRFCPSADVLFSSVARAYGRQAIGVILTGMGEDGAQGLLALRHAGGLTLGQDEASCVVYGMPQAAFKAGAVSKVVPLHAMAAAIREYLQQTQERL